MHSSHYKGIEDGPWDILHNGDFSGDVTFIIPTYHPNRHYSDRVRFFENKKQRERFAKLIHSPEDLKPDGYTVMLPYQLLENIVVDKIRSQMIERLEELTTEELIRELIK